MSVHNLTVDAVTRAEHNCNYRPTMDICCIPGTLLHAAPAKWSASLSRS
jgi:hypothetical protein